MMNLNKWSQPVVYTVVAMNPNTLYLYTDTFCAINIISFWIGSVFYDYIMKRTLVHLCMLVLNYKPYFQEDFL